MDKQYQDLKIERVLTNQLGVEVGVIALKRPEALNALNDAMITGITRQLQLWATDDSIEMVVIRGVGDRAYCAGGDIKALYEAGNVQFLAKEYRLDYALYHYPKPIIHIMHGIVMGGGMGLMASAALKLCSVNSEFAMPETAIGFFPDVGYRYHLARMPNGLGAFLGLTGARATSKFARMLGIVDGVLPQTERSILISFLYDRIAQWRRSDGSILEWVKSWALEQEAHTEQEELTEQEEQATQEALSIESVLPKEIRDWCDLYWDLPGFTWWNDLEKLVNEPSPCPDFLKWQQGALDQLSPLSIALTDLLLRRAAVQELAQVFDEDYWTAAKLYVDGDLREGVLAKMLEKRAPNWLYIRQNITREVIAQFTPPDVIASVLRKKITWQPTS